MAQDNHEMVEEAQELEAVELAEESGAVLRKKEFLDRIVAESGAKRKVAKDVAEAALKVLAESIASGETLVLQPLGTLKVAKLKPGRNGGGSYTLKLRHPGAKTNSSEDEENAPEPLAQAGE